MQGIFSVKYNWQYFIFFAIVFRMVTIGVISWEIYFSFILFSHQFSLLFGSLGHIMPVRYLLGTFMCLQMCVGPSLAYMGLDEYQNGYLKMQIPEETYFSYVLPAVTLFIVGLHISAGKLNGEIIDIERISQFVSKNQQLPYVLIFFGFFSSFLSGFFGSELAFVFTIIGNFKFVGTFLILLGHRKLKPGILILVFSSIILSSIANAMFHDLLTWIIFLGAVFSARVKPKPVYKVVAAALFIILAISIQMIKGGYREATWRDGKEAGISTFQDVVVKTNDETGFFNTEKLAQSNIRINQGAIITNIMKNVPAQMPHANGEQLYQIIESAIFPRLFAPNKLNAGDREFFMKYSGMRIARGTSMGLSAVGDFYINFGIAGGWICMFLYGLMFSEILKIFGRNSTTYPILTLFVCVVFYYPIRPDCELQTILGHLVKSSFLLFIIIQIWKSEMSIPLIIKKVLRSN